MRSLTIFIIFLLLFLPACSLGNLAPAAPLTTDNPTLASPDRPGEAPGHCGDEVCDGPENATNCPQDCDRPTPTPLAETPAIPEVQATGVVEPGPEPNTYRVINPASQARLYVQVIHPQDWDGSALPTLILVPGGSADSSRFVQPPSQAQLMADAGLTIIVFDPDGRGQSEGVEDDNGFSQQDGLAALIRFAATLPEVDAARMGLVSYSYGVTMATGALARHPDLPIQFLIDWEGPANRNDTGGCDEAQTGHLQGHPCDDEDFWQEREAATFALNLPVPYQRLQSEKDHAQPDNAHALLMMANATAAEYGGHGMSPWTRLNNLTPNTLYTVSNPPPMLPEGQSQKPEPLIIHQAFELFDLFCPTAAGSNPSPDEATAAASVISTGQAQVLITIDSGPNNQAIRPLLGVNIGPIPAGEPGNADLTAAYQNIGVTTIRTHDYYGPLDMATIYPDQNADPLDPASYDFEASDQVFAAILAGGFEPYLRLGDSWHNAPSYPPADPRRPINPANWVQAAVEVVRHYNDPDLWGGSHLRYVEIWNEPDHPQFWDGSPPEFFELFAAAAVALKAEFPHLMIGGPGLTVAAFKTPHGQAYTENFLAHLQSQAVPLDFFSWHIYSNDPADFPAAAAYYRAQLDGHGYPTAESHITEWNTAVGEGRSETDPALRIGARGAALLTAAWIGLQEQGVAVSTFYRGPDAAQNHPTFYGMFYADGRPKPIALAFSLWAEMAAHPTRLNVSLSGGSNPGQLWVLAGQNGSGEMALLLANPTDTSTSWQAFFPNNQAAPQATLSIRQISDPAEAIQEFEIIEPSVEIGAYTVQLVTLTP
ncbi:MAG: hypothetical protein JW953_03630 [Anaerolineae bacterium]|nr:hypothetical protein [Anaerolineae bacterium]